MKKSIVYKIVLLLIAFFLISINDVSAKDQLIKVGENDVFYYGEDSGNIYQKSVLYKDGYLSLLKYDYIPEALYPHYILTYVSMNGNIREVLDGIDIMDFTTDGNYIYIMSTLNGCQKYVTREKTREADDSSDDEDESETEECSEDEDCDSKEDEEETETVCEIENAKKILKYDSNFNLVGSIDYSYEKPGMLAKINKFKVTYDENTKEHIFFYKTNNNKKDIIIVDKEFQNYKDQQLNDENLKKYFYTEYLQENYKYAGKENKIFTSFDAKDGIVVATGTAEENGKSNALMIYKVDDIELFEITNEDYTEFTETKLIGNGVVTIGIKEEAYASDLKKSDILVYDLEGNLIQVLSNNGKYFSFDTNGEKFIASTFDSSKEADQHKYGNIFGANQAKASNVIYDVDGMLLKGMSSSITNRNPVTADIALFGLVLTAIISGIILSKSYKKQKWLK